MAGSRELGWLRAARRRTTASTGGGLGWEELVGGGAKEERSRPGPLVPDGGSEAAARVGGLGQEELARGVDASEVGGGVCTAAGWAGIELAAGRSGARGEEPGEGKGKKKIMIVH